MISLLNQPNSEQLCEENRQFSMSVERENQIGIVFPDLVHPEESSHQLQIEQYKKKFLHQLDLSLGELKKTVTKGHIVKIFLSHAWHDDALTADDRNNPDIVEAALYYDSLCWWLYEALTKAGFMVLFDREKTTIRLLGAEGFMAKSVDESDIVLSVCTKLYHDRSEIESTGVGKEITLIRKRVDREGLGFYLPVLVSYKDMIKPKDLLPNVLQGYNPIYVDARCWQYYVTNLWCILAELYLTKAKKWGNKEHAALMKKDYIGSLDNLRRIPDAFHIEDGTSLHIQEATRRKESIYSDLLRKANAELEEGGTRDSKSMNSLISFAKINELSANLFEDFLKQSQKTPWMAMFFTLTGKQRDWDSNNDYMEACCEVCNLLFQQKLSDNVDEFIFRNWIVLDSPVKPTNLRVGIQFGSYILESCRLYGVNYLWFNWLHYVNEEMIYDYDSLNLLSKLFDLFYEWITRNKTIEMKEIEEKLHDRGNGFILSSTKFTAIRRKQIFVQRFLSMCNIGGPVDESVARLYHLAAVAQIPNEIDLASKPFNQWKTWGQQYLDYFFSVKILSMELGSNTDSYLTLAKRLGCQPSMNQWHVLIDQMLLSKDEELLEKYGKILLGFLSEVKMDMKLVLHHKDYKGQTIVKKIAHYVMKNDLSSSPSVQESYKRICPEIEWLVTLATLIPKKLPEDKQALPILSLSGPRFLPSKVYNQLFDPIQHCFSPKESNHKGGFKEENGRHTVGFVQNRFAKNSLCFKMNPEFPMIEQAGLALMYRLFGYPGIPFSEVIRLNRMGSSVFLVSNYVDGIRADEVFSRPDHVEIINKLDKQRVGELIMYSIFSNPEDGRLQNYIFVPSDRDPNLYKIVAIDIDHSFAAAIPQKLPGWFSKETKTSSVVFTLPLMMEPIAESIQERLKTVDVEELFLGWLSDLERLEHDYRKLYHDDKNERMLYETTTTLTLPMNYARLMHVYWKLKELKSFLMDYERIDEISQPTYMEALKRVEKFTGDRYEAVNESKVSVAERFKKSDGRLSSSMIRGDFRDYALHFNEKGSNALQTIAQVKETLRQKKQQYQKDIQEFEKLKEDFQKLSAAEQEELFVSCQMRCTTAKAMDPEIQKKWLDLVLQFICEWRSLIVRNNAILSRNWFLDASTTAFYNLTFLELHDCSEVTGEVLDILSSQKNCRLEGVILSSLENLRTLCARSVFGMQTNYPLELPDLKSIRFIKNINLKRIHINSAKLRHLVIEDCSHIEWMSFENVNHLKSLQYDDATIRDNDNELSKGFHLLKAERSRLLALSKVVTDSITLKANVNKYKELDALYCWFVCLPPPAGVLMEEYSRICSLFTHDGLTVLMEKINNYKNLVELHNLFLTLNPPTPQQRVLQTAFHYMISLFKNGCSNLQIIRNEIDHYPRLQNLYEEFIKNDHEWEQHFGITEVNNSFDYYRFINGKLIFRPNKENDIGMIELPFYQFVNQAEGEFDLTGLQYYSTLFKQTRSVSDDVSINIGYRKEKMLSHRGKTEVWIVPKFMVEKHLTTSSKHLEWYLDEWTSPIGIFFTSGESDDFSPASRYLTTKRLNQIHNQTLGNLWNASKKHKNAGFPWESIFYNLSLIF